MKKVNFKRMDTYLGLGLATIGALPIPPFGAITIDNVTRSTLHGDLGTRDRDQRTCPLLVTESGFAREDDSGATVQLGKFRKMGTISATREPH